MTKEVNVRWGWLKGMYVSTIVVAGLQGLGLIIMPDVIRSMSGWPTQDPIVLGICGSVYVAFGFLSILGLRSPLKFAPILLLQLVYKVVWCIGVMLPLLHRGSFPAYGIVYAVIFALFVIGDLIAIPFSYVFAKQSENQGKFESGSE
jgi:hypothetical protein